MIRKKKLNGGKTELFAYSNNKQYSIHLFDCANDDKILQSYSFPNISKKELKNIIKSLNLLLKDKIDTTQVLEFQQEDSNV